MMWIPMFDDLPRRRTIDPSIKALFDRLPASGSEWPIKDQRYWLAAIEAVFYVVYRGEDPQLAKDDNIDARD